MQDRYAGDVGDFFKLALLERLCAPRDPRERELSLGIVWYLVDDESHNNDGKHITYLDPATPAGQALRPISPRTYDALRAVAAGDRSVRRIEESGALAPGTVSFSERLRLGDLPSHDRGARMARRSGWLDRAVASVAGRDLVCLDPDNGIRRDDHAVGRHRNRSEKHSYLSEVAALVGDEGSLVAYHHADRSAPVREQARRRMEDVAGALGREPLAAIGTSRGSARLFLVVPAERHRARLGDRVAELENGVAAAEFTVIRYRTR